MSEIVVFSPLAWDSHIMGKNTLYTSHNQYQCMLNRSHCTIGHAAIAFIFITSMMSPGQYSLCPFWQKVATVTSVFIDFQFQTTCMKMLMQICTRQSSFLGGHPKIPGLHFARQPSVGSWNVGCFLRLMKYLNRWTALQYINNLETKWSYKTKVNLKNPKFFKNSAERFKSYSLICSRRPKCLQNR